jgi:hypothetical protein
VVVLVIFCSLMCIAFFKLLDKTIGMRSDSEHEISGLDMPEMGAMAYPDFLEAQGPVFYPIESTGLEGASVSGKGLREEVGH